MQSDYPTLDEAQERRIAAVHRGFLYQHLFAVGCLLKASSFNVQKVVIERDEDVEVVLPDTRIYVQVKTRSEPLAPNDIDTSFERFELLRQQHHEGARHGKPIFVVASNQPLGPKLARSIVRGDLPHDVQFIHPGVKLAGALSCLPGCLPDLSGAVADCIQLAEQIPHALLMPESLVWKLAGKVQAAATGSEELGGFTFSADMLPELFEQLVTQLQGFPSQLALYRPQVNEPALINGERIRIICGFSGVGKTSWCAQAAMHSPERCIYFNATGTTGSGLAISLVRDIAGGYSEKPQVIKEIFAAGVSGIDSLVALDRHLNGLGISPLVVIDNAHELPAKDLQAVFGCTPSMRFILLCQPTGSTQEVEQLSAVRREVLQGWSLDSVAAEVSSLGAHGDVKTMERLRLLTGGLPLYLQSAARLAVQDYEGDLAFFCDALEGQATLDTTAQEIILARVYEGLSEASRQVVSFLSIVDVSITQDELLKLMESYAGMPAATVNNTLRALRPLGVLEVQGNREVKIHDAMRLVGASHLHAVQAGHLHATKLVLRDLLYASLVQKRSFHRLRLFVRTVLDLRETEFIVELAGNDMFQETGLGGEVIDYLEASSTAADIDPEMRFWALDSLIYLNHRSEDPEIKVRWLSAMSSLVSANQLSEAALLSYHQKKMSWQSEQGDAAGVCETIELVKQLPGMSPERRLVFDYNAAAAYWGVGRTGQAEALVTGVIQSYLKLLNITEQWILDRPLPEVMSFLGLTNVDPDNVKRLAEAYELQTLCMRRRRLIPVTYRLLAFKFFMCVGAYSSAVRVGLDAAQDMMDQRDFPAALAMVGETIIPLIHQAQLLDELNSARSFYAVILAYCRDFDSAEQEMALIAPFRSAFTESKREEYDFQLQLIRDIRAGRVR